MASPKDMKSRNPMARDLRTPKYRPRVVENKKKSHYKKRKHKGDDKYERNSKPDY